MLSQSAVGIALGALVAAIAWRSRALTASGVVAAALVGAVTFVAGGWPGAAVLFAFFVPSVLLSRVGRAQKSAIVDVGKHGARDAWQVLANGGIAACCVAVAAGIGIAGNANGFESSKLAVIWLAAFAGAFAAAAADTWGTEIGTLTRGTPRSILSLRPVASGLSGGVTAAGTAAEVCGAAFVALVALLTGIAGFVPVVVGGFAGAIVDSILGASAQALRWCPACSRACETDPHHCGTATTLRRGAAWFGNDAVNLAATLCGAAVAGILAAVLPTSR